MTKTICWLARKLPMPIRRRARLQAWCRRHLSSGELTHQVLGTERELSATATVTRDGGTVRITVLPDGPLPAATRWSALLAEPVHVSAGDLVIVEVRPEGCCLAPLQMHAASDADVLRVFSFYV